MVIFELLGRVFHSTQDSGLLHRCPAGGITNRDLWRWFVFVVCVRWIGSVVCGGLPKKGSSEHASPDALAEKTQ